MIALEEPYKADLIIMLFEVKRMVSSRSYQGKERTIKTLIDIKLNK